MIRNKELVNTAAMVQGLKWIIGTGWPSLMAVPHSRIPLPRPATSTPDPRTFHVLVLSAFFKLIAYITSRALLYMRHFTPHEEAQPGIPC